MKGSAYRLQPHTSCLLVSNVIVLSILVASLVSCNKGKVFDETSTDPTTLVIRFENKVDTFRFMVDTADYINSSGNVYKVTDLQYFVSDITLHRSDGAKFIIQKDYGIHYIDARIPSTLTWLVNTEVPWGTFDSVSFTFGISEIKNYSNRFPNPPERDMNWPDVLGGGYHYMKMNILWGRTAQWIPYPFNFHIGIGQIYKGNVINPDSISSFVQNYFDVNLPSSGFSLTESHVKYMVISMNVNKWFTGNNQFDFSKYPNTMMQKQNMMNNACLNGRKAFSVRFTDKGK